MSVRVHELAKELGIPSKDLIERLKKLRLPVKGATSTVDDDMVARIRQAMATLRPGALRTPVKTAPAAKPSATKTVAAKPVPSVVKGAKPAAKADGKAPVAPVAPTAVKPSAPVAPPVKAAPTPPPAPVKPAVSAPVKPPAPAPVKPVVSVPPIARPAPAPQPAPKSAGLAGAAPAQPAPKSAGPAGAPAAVAVAAAPVAPAPTKELKPLQLRFPLSVKDLAGKLDVKANDLIRHLISKRIFASLTQMLDQEVATQVARDFGFELAPAPTVEEEVELGIAPDPAKFVARAPVVTFMGHVDHGKTSLLDAIRKTKVTEGEAGGITQHIGAYEVALPKGHVTFLDTPGHEAFTALRARGANVTDIVVLVVAADDGVMPQTIEAIDHAKAANVPILVAMNKIDKPDANPDKIKKQLAEHGLVAEDWGGKTVLAPVSAKTGQGIDELLELLLLEAELLELKADPTTPAQGTVIDARMAKDRGPVATLLVQHGVLHVGQMIVVGSVAGRVRALTNDRGHRVKEAGPAMPVEVLGLPSIPKSGDRFIVMADEKLARQIVDRRQEHATKQGFVPPKRVTLDDLHARIASGQLRELKLILKADVQGSLEAIVQQLGKIDTKEVKLNTIHMGAGDISESDVMLAAASDAVIIGFHVGVDPMVQVEAINQGVDIRIYAIIYEAVNNIKLAIEGLLEPKTEETFLGRAQIRKLFQISKTGIVAGCIVNKGVIRRDAVIRVIRGKDRIVETKIASLKRVKDDVREVAEGLECGISLEGKVDLEPGDLIEAWELKKVARKLA